MSNSKARANVLAVDERQQLETLTRDEKTTNRTLVQLTERRQGFEEKIATRNEDLSTQTGKRAEVIHYYRPVPDAMLT
jgi:structural maintenance of chromosome 1